MTDLENRLSARLHGAAVQLVPDTTVPRPLPPPAGHAALRWRAPVLAAAAVLVVAVGITVAVQSHRGGPALPAAGAAHASPVLNSPAASFACMDLKASPDGVTPQDQVTLHAAQAGMFRIGITADTFCITAGTGFGAAGSGLRPSGALRSWVSSEQAVAGAVDPSVDRVVWVPRGTDEKSGTTVDLYSLGPMKGFAVPIHSSGTLLLYSGSSEIAREQIPFPGQGPAAASSSAAATSYPATAPMGKGQQASIQAARSYPPGQGPTSKPGTWPTNARGQTYGSAAGAGGVTGEPDLIAAVATNGKPGYVLRTDLELPSPANPSEAVAHNTTAPRTIPVYQSDGITQIGVFILGATSGTEIPSPGDVISSSAASSTR